MGYNYMDDEELNNMVSNILNGNQLEEKSNYVDEKQKEFLDSLQSMVEDKDRALQNYRNLR